MQYSIQRYGTVVIQVYRNEMMPPIVSDVQLYENKKCVRYCPGTAWLGE